MRLLLLYFSLFLTIPIFAQNPEIDTLVNNHKKNDAFIVLRPHPNRNIRIAEVIPEISPSSRLVQLSVLDSLNRTPIIATIKLTDKKSRVQTVQTSQKPNYPVYAPSWSGDLKISDKDSILVECSAEGFKTWTGKIMFEAPACITIRLSPLKQE